MHLSILTLLNAALLVSASPAPQFPRPSKSTPARPTWSFKWPSFPLTTVTVLSISTTTKLVTVSPPCPTIPSAIPSTTAPIPTIPSIPSTSASPPTPTGDDHDHGHGGGAESPTFPPGIDLPLPSGFFIEPPIDVAKPKTPGARVVDQLLGPYLVKAGEAKNIFGRPGKGIGEGPLPGNELKMPCENCWIVATQAMLEYKDGKEANIDTGAWLHHMVMSVRTKNPSPGKFDCPPINITDLLNRPRPSGLTLPSGISLPTSLPTGILGGASGGSGGVGGFGGSRVLWSTGNERTVNRINALGKLGNFVTTTAEMSPFMIMELMNESKEDAEYYLRFRYEVLDKDAPEAEGYQQSAAIWMDVGGCTGSDVPAKEGVYEVKSPEFKVAYGGRLISTHAHLHDGGTHITVYKNGAPICTSKANYGRKASTREPAGSAHGGMLHISETSACRDFGEVEKGDVLTITAFYDAIKYPQMVHGGELHPVMGISLITVEPKPAFAV